MSTTNTSQDLTDQDVAKLIDAISNGMSIADAVNLPSEALESLYTLGYNLFSAQSYTDAETIFKALCLYNHHDYRFWMGLAGCQQALGEYKNAVEAYGMAGIASNLKNPEPFWFAANCYLKLNDKENAEGVIGGLLTMCDENNPQHVVYKEKSQALLEILK